MFRVLDDFRQVRSCVNIIILAMSFLFNSFYNLYFVVVQRVFLSILYDVLTIHFHLI